MDAPFSRDLRDAIAECTTVSRSVQAQLNMLTAGQSALDARVTKLDEEHVPRAERTARAAARRADEVRTSSVGNSKTPRPGGGESPNPSVT